MFHPHSKSTSNSLCRRKKTCNETHEYGGDEEIIGNVKRDEECGMHVPSERKIVVNHEVEISSKGSTNKKIDHARNLEIVDKLKNPICQMIGLLETKRKLEMR